MYLKLRSRQLGRILASIGPLRCIFLVLLCATLFYLLPQIENPWILPACGVLLIGFYHTQRKDREFLALQIKKFRRLLAIEYLLVTTPFTLAGILTRNYLSVGVICLAAMLFPLYRPIKTRIPKIPLPGFYTGDLLYRRMFRRQILPYLILLFLALMGGIHGNIRIGKACLMIWGILEGTAFLELPQLTELALYRDFKTFQKRLLAGMVWNVVLTSIPLAALILCFSPEWKQAGFILTVSMSTILYLCNLATARFFHSTTVTLWIYGLVLPLPLFFFSCFIPLILIPFLLFQAGICLMAKTKFSKLWN